MKMEIFTTGILMMTNVMASELYNWLRMNNLWENSKMILFKGSENILSMKAIFTKDSGKTTHLMVSVFSLKKMAKPT